MGLSNNSYFLPARRANPEEFGIHLAGLKMLGLNRCQGTGAHFYPNESFYFNQWGGHLGHAHICEKDPDLGMICTNEKWLKNRDGTYSEILLHELAHLLTKYPIFNVKCNQDYDSHQWTYTWNPEKLADVKEWGHGPEWIEWANKFDINPKPWPSQETMLELINL